MTGPVIAAALAVACGRPPAPVRPPSVLLITIDTLRADRVRPDLTPTLAALAREGIAWPQARATAPLTLPSHATILTGALPPEHGLRENGAGRLDQSRPTLATVLRARGYQTAAFVGAYVLDRRFGLANGFDHYDDRILRDPNAPARLEAERRGAEVARAAATWLRAADAGRPFFVWAHFYDPHAPYDPPAEFARRAGQSAYDAEVSYADAQARAVVDAARQRAGAGLLIVAAGDHGEGLGEHGEATHGMLAYDSTLRVPVIFSGARSSAIAAVAQPASLRDLAPTLLAALAIDVPGEMTGAAHTRQGEGVPAPRLTADVYAESIYPRAAGWSPVRVLFDGQRKLIASSVFELYDLGSDAGELRDVATRDRAAATAMAARADRIFDSGQSAAGRISAEASARLRALGYVSASPSSPSRLGTGGPNPRDHIGAWNEFESALSLLAAGRSGEALPALRALSSAHPNARVFQTTYAQALKDNGRMPDALRVLRSVVARWSDDASAFHDFAVAAREAGDAREAMKAEQAALALDPGDPNAHNGLGLLHADAGSAGHAALSFQRATDLDPTNASFWTNLGNARRALGDLAAAEQAYRRALDLHAGFADAANGMGVILVQQRRPAEAIAWFERAIAAEPSLHEAQLNLGIAYQESGDTRRAAEQYRKVIAAAPAGSHEKRAAGKLLAALR
ncbi:MAG TPA: sulfatase-like hydrolase/transferase [Vicinamibacterales bacterium]|nr:sulfatase-like hydrolase/transferase [Vicinamibacterales bacterium]